jgi:hypothetical protein
MEALTNQVNKLQELQASVQLFDSALNLAYSVDIEWDDIFRKLEKDATKPDAEFQESIDEANRNRVLIEHNVSDGVTQLSEEQDGDSDAKIRFKARWAKYQLNHDL